MALKALVFDAYGTLFDVHSVVAECERRWPGQGGQFSQLWRAKQLEYTWLLSLMNRYRDFAAITEDALAYATMALNLTCDDDCRRALMDEYRRLAPYPETVGVLTGLRDAGCKLAILSNGSPEMLRAVVAHAGLTQLLDAVMSVDPLQIYKPSARVYQLAVERLGLPTDRIGFVSSNGWDAAGAKAFGFEVFWINRLGAPVDELGVEPDHALSSLAELPSLLQ